jgi:hypothetical protein
LLPDLYVEPLSKKSGLLLGIIVVVCCQLSEIEDVTVVVQNIGTVIMTKVVSAGFESEGFPNG